MYKNRGELLIPQDKLDKVGILAPHNDGGSFLDYLSMSEMTYSKPFSDRRCESLVNLSQDILQDVQLRNDPASVALAYWLRRANLHRLKEQFEKRLDLDKTIMFVPVGRVFHITPANVDTLFVYSWALSFICGNANVVRISSQPDAIVKGLVESINRIMEQDDDLRISNKFITYEHDKDVTEAISRWCTHRVIWGGDETAKTIRPLYINPHASERVFASKFSYAVVNSQRFCETDQHELEKIMSNFYNDMYLFDQMACSSPHIVFWIGTYEAMQHALSIFSTNLMKEIKRHQYAASAPQVIKRLNVAFDLACSTDIRVDLQNSGFVSITKIGVQQLERIVCGGGLLTHVQVDKLQQINEFASEVDQTITHFGLTDAELNQLAMQVGSKGVDRLVPIGQALAFSPNWDGYDLIGDFTRRVTIVSER